MPKNIHILAKPLISSKKYGWKAVCGSTVFVLFSTLGQTITCKRCLRYILQHN